MIKKIINQIFGIFGLKLIKATHVINSNKQGYISTQETVKYAHKEGLSVCDYVETLWDQVGGTQKIIDKMKEFGAFEIENPTVCEIGAGTGRYMEKVLEKCKPSRYESYETAADWAEWLTAEYPIISQSADGFSLNSTKDNSIDLVHAHGVFVYLPFFDSLQYFKEINRVAKKNAIIIFDCMTEDCLDTKTLNKWLESEYSYPQLLSEKYVFDFFQRSNYKLIGNFFTPYGQGKSKYFVFRKIS